MNPGYDRARMIHLPQRAPAPKLAGLNILFTVTVDACRKQS
jgi:hypothetical protein